MNINQVQFLSVPVADHRKAKDFYVGTLGFEVRFEQEGPHGTFLMVGPSSGQTGLVLVDFPVPGVDFGGPLSFQLSTDDVDADVAALRASGVEVADAQEMPWGRTTKFTDPDGNSVGLAQLTV
ncbi:VOC family protein [Amycolatopsis nigrescens]|uniref:VOC family protein n=1 Tax=Amycolatopsis nigrescens TaxID=381445 RepID=UPI00035F717D|nr:VOC family protein [Amycolatopsis nigrescens]